MLGVTKTSGRATLLTLLTLIASALGVSCGSDSPSTGEDPAFAAAARAEFAHLDSAVIRPALMSAKSAHSNLKRDVDAWKANVTDDALRMTAATSLSAFNQAWQEVEVMNFGPLGMEQDVTGGMDLRDDIYSWPSASACTVDGVIADQGYGESAKLAALAVNRRGLDALAYLIHHAEGHACEADSETAQKWASISNLAQRRADYASVVTTLIGDKLNQIESAWVSFADNNFVVAGQSGSTFPTAQQALNEVSNALFYLETESKDMKIGVPAGIHADCLETICPDDLEFAHEGGSKEAIIANLKGFKKLFAGADGKRSFYALLVMRDKQELADKMLGEADKAIAEAEKLGPFRPAIEADKNALNQLYNALSGVARLMKTEFVSVLDLELPKRAEGDND